MRESVERQQDFDIKYNSATLQLKTLEFILLVMLVILVIGYSLLCRKVFFKYICTRILVRWAPILIALEESYRNKLMKSLNARENDVANLP